jgi:hypothetical protein
MGKRDQVVSNQSIEDYLVLLEIQLRAARRNTWISGSVLIFSLAALLVVGLLNPISQREAILITVLISAFALGFIASLARREALNAARELARSIMAREQAP